MAGGSTSELTNRELAHSFRSAVAEFKDIDSAVYHEKKQSLVKSFECFLETNTSGGTMGRVLPILVLLLGLAGGLGAQTQHNSWSN